MYYFSNSTIGTIPIPKNTQRSHHNGSVCSPGAKATIGMGWGMLSDEKLKSFYLRHREKPMWRSRRIIFRLCRRPRRNCRSVRLFSREARHYCHKARHISHKAQRISRSTWRVSHSAWHYCHSVRRCRRKAWC